MSVPVSALNTVTNVDVTDLNAYKNSFFSTITKADVTDLSAGPDVHSYLQEMRDEDQFTFEALPDNFLDNYLSQVCVHVCGCVLQYSQ